MTRQQHVLDFGSERNDQPSRYLQQSNYKSDGCSVRGSCWQKTNFGCGGI